MRRAGVVRTIGMDTSLLGKHAVVCGSTAGIGRAAAIALATLGAGVTLIARNADKLRAACESLPRPRGDRQHHHWIAADFTDTASVRAAAETLMREDARAVHVLVNNTGGPPPGRAIDADPAAYLAAFSAHLVSAQILARAFAPGMIAARYGRIINVISTSVKAPIPDLGVSNTVRGAMASWAKTLAGELGPSGITVNNVLPGFTRTERLEALLTSRAAASGRDRAAVAADLMASIPAGRFAEADEIASAIAFLASPAAGYINGINLPVDGGRLPTL